MGVVPPGEVVNSLGFFLNPLVSWLDDRLRRLIIIESENDGFFVKSDEFLPFPGGPNFSWFPCFLFDGGVGQQ